MSVSTLPRVELRYLCRMCNRSFKTEDAARSCCIPIIHTAWACLVCGKEYVLKSTAENCCPDEEPTGIIFPGPEFQHNAQGYIAEFNRLNGLKP